MRPARQAHRRHLAGRPVEFAVSARASSRTCSRTSRLVGRSLARNSPPYTRSAAAAWPGGTPSRPACRAVWPPRRQPGGVGDRVEHGREWTITSGRPIPFGVVLCSTNPRAAPQGAGTIEDPVEFGVVRKGKCFSIIPIDLDKDEGTAAAPAPATTRAPPESGRTSPPRSPHLGPGSFS